MDKKIISNFPIAKIEKAIGYEFINKDLLIQAFKRESFSVENKGQNNEILEHIGDTVLDFIVKKDLFCKSAHIALNEECINNIAHGKEYISPLNEGEITEKTKELVCNDKLAEVVDNLGLSEYLIMGIGDIKQNIQNIPKVKADLFEAIVGAMLLDSHWDISLIEKSILRMLDLD